MQDGIKTKRGRPPAYDRDAALAAMQACFMRHGFGDTSLEVIAQATGMNRPSLFGAFGNKQAMYMAALEDYRAKMQAALDPVLSADGPLADVLPRYFDAAISHYTAGAVPGCLVFCTASTDAADNGEVGAVLRSVVDGVRETLCLRLVRAGEARAEGLSVLLVGLLMKLAIGARAGESATQLRAEVRSSLAALAIA